MSVEVKTPTRTQFEHTEFHCGEKQLTSRGSPPLRKFSFSDNVNKNQNEGKQIRKRRFSQFRAETNQQHQAFGFKRKRLKSMPSETIVLPTKFLLGGNINDPLNLNSMNDKEIDKVLNEKTPVSSPLPTPLHRQKVEVHIPTNITDPLNLNLDEDWSLTKGGSRNKKKRQHKNKKKGDTSQNTSTSSVLSTSVLKEPCSEKRKGLLEALRIEIDDDDNSVPSVQDNRNISTLSTESPENAKTVSVPNADKIVSPVIPQISPSNSFYRRRRRTLSMSDARPEPSSSVSRSILRTSLSPPRASFDLDKVTPTPPKKFKRQFSQKPIEKITSCSTSNKQFSKKGKFIYGNYNRYYGYRNPDTADDQRLMSFRKEWFEGKDAIDIGCNVGHVTLAVAKEMHPRKIIGIDIDSSLIAAARKNVRHYISKENMSCGSFPISNTLSYGPIAAPPVNDVYSYPKFPHNVVFVQGNYVLERDELLELQKEDYDVILALSLTKWVHLNFGDDGLKRMFKRIYRQLRPGGRLILEPQPWSSYKKKKKLTPEIYQIFKSISFKPEQFSDYLLSKEVGFSTCEVVDTPFNKSKGFRRTIQLFTKPETAANSPKQDTATSTETTANSPKQDTATSTETTTNSPKQDTATSAETTTNSQKQDTATSTETTANSPQQDTATSMETMANSPKQDTATSMETAANSPIQEDAAASTETVGCASTPITSEGKEKSLETCAGLEKTEPNSVDSAFI
ncbi:7SK snRNA methylphosphate capping enzyme-like [Pecten maximus]|uniref:7SK snRNA methylphosphate capping enzyme-like n=1 Tax=Pecten maximus TaxID=6579 RepID=UPI0014583E43|nr:7SK snRNA methylphosphate capping enzyme-like [Pecten maximus]